MSGGTVSTTPFILNDYGSGTSLMLDFVRCEIALAGATPFVIENGRTDYVMTFTNCDISGTFQPTFDAPYRNALTFTGCRSLGAVMVQNTTSYALLDVEVVNCWAQPFEAGPRPLAIAGRFMNGINLKKTFNSFNAATAVSLADPSLYATTSTLCDKVGFGNAGFGFESQLGYKTFLATSLNQIALTFSEMMPAGSVVLGCQLATLDSNYLANTNTGFPCIFIGDTSDFRRYGTLSGPNGFTMSVNTDGFLPFMTAAAKDIIVRGAWDIGSSQTWTWSGTSISIGSGFFTSAMVGNKIHFSSGSLAGTETTVTAYVNSTTLTVADSHTGSGSAVMFIPFATGRRFWITPAYLEMAANAGILTMGARNNFFYAEPITPS